MIIERDLIRAINSGKCLALIGAGPSIEVGLPAWKKLTQDAIALLKTEDLDHLRSKIEDLIEKGEYPQVFSIVANQVGVGTLVSWLSTQIEKFDRDGKIYKLIATWPFANYLTTNYDKALIHYLHKAKVAAVEKLNNRPDMTLLNDGAKDLIFKIHGDPSRPDDIILTTEQYQDFTTSPERKYWQEKIKAALHYQRIVIIGYSLKDPYFMDFLQQVKDFNSKQRPVYVFASGFDETQIDDYFKQYNISIIPYTESQGSHRELYKTLRRFGIFVAARTSERIGAEEVDIEEMEIASSLYLFSKLRLSEANGNPLAKAYAITILKILFDARGKPIKQADIIQSLEQKLKISTHADPESISTALDLLQGKGYIQVVASAEYSIAQLGNQEISHSGERRKIIEEQFNVACLLFLEEDYPSISTEDQKLIVEEMITGITLAFEKRGLEIARHVYKGSPVDAADALDLIEAINVGSNKFEDQVASAAYIDLMIEIITRPNKEMKSFLALVSQGYFAYHALGWDRKSTEQRLSLARDKTWVLDASIIIPALAKNCLNHSYAIDLISRAAQLGLKLTTTKLLFSEVVDHAKWALDKFKNADPQAADLLLAATGGASYRPNLFISGFIDWSTKMGSDSLRDYFADCFGEGYKEDFESSLLSSVNAIGIDVVEFNDVPGFTEDLLAERDENLAPLVKQRRSELGTFRSDQQCLAEAEVLILARKFGYNFLSRSTILNTIDGSKITLDPEALYKFIALFSDTPPDADLAFSSMTNYFYSAGIDIVDVNSISKYVEPSLQQARIKLENETKSYEKLIGSQLFKEQMDALDNAPMELKPFYSIRIAMLIAQKELELREKLERKVNIKKEGDGLSGHERTELERFRSKARERSRLRKKKRRAKLSNPKKKKKRN